MKEFLVFSDLDKLDDYVDVLNDLDIRYKVTFNSSDDDGDNSGVIEIVSIHSK